MTGSRRRRIHVAIGALLLVAAACSDPSPSEDAAPATTTPTANVEAVPSTATSEPDAPRTVDSLLIKHGWDIPNPTHVRDNADALDALGFDGLVVQIPSSGKILSPEPISFEQAQAELAPLLEASLTRLTHNFVIIYNGPVGGFDADDWVTPRSNVTNLARAAEEAGLQGIFFDNENYDNKLSWRADGNEKENNARFQAATDRGAEFMRAIGEGWAEATLISLHGPALSEKRTSQVYSQAFPYNDTSWANPVLGHFFMGMAVGAEGTDLTLIDGGEVYQLRTKADFQLAYDWMLDGLINETDLAPEALRPNYNDAVDAGFGVFDRPVLDVPMDVNLWESTLVEALLRTDGYVWAYTERYDWTGVGHPAEPVPDSWRAATINALEAVRSGKVTD